MKAAHFFKASLFCLAMCATALNLSSCSDDDDEVVAEPNITLTSGQNSLSLDWEKGEASLKFTATAPWKAALEGANGSSCDWVKLPKTEGEAGDVSLPFLVYENNSEFSRDATLTLSCGEKSTVITIHQNANPDAVKYIDKADIPDYDKYICPGVWNDGFQKGPDHMLRDDAKWSWHRHAQSEHFFVFWEPQFGPDPNSSDVPAALRVDIEDLLAKAEQFYQTNIETLKMVEVGQGKSYLDDYKMQIYILYQTEWLATGSGYDNTIGALWVNPSTCQPVGSTIAHEIGHSFQYQVSCDKIKQGLANELFDGNGWSIGYDRGFRYGYAEGGAGGNGFWEQCAQWQSFQDYPAEAYAASNINVWLPNYHRHFNHEWMRYQSYWFQYYWIMKHGVDAVGKIWNEAKYPEDPLMTYQRVFCGNDQNALYAALYDYATRMVTYDLGEIGAYVTDAAKNYKTTLFDAADNYYQVGYASCPETTGFNIIKLNVPEAGSTVKVHFKGLASGSALAAADPGNVLDVNGATIATTTTYNKTDDSGNWRYGFVAIAGGKPEYSQMNSGKEGTATYTIPANTTQLYLVVLAAPDTYASHPWDDDETNDAQWPYQVKFENTGVFGEFTIDTTKEPTDVTLSYDLTCDAGQLDVYDLGVIDLRGNQELAQAFVMKPVIMESLILPVGSEPEEGKIVVGIPAEGGYTFAGNANNGFWCHIDGTLGGWGEGGVFFEFRNGLDLAYGFRPANTFGEDVTTPTPAGTKAVMKPTLIYTKDGKQYKATITLNMQF